jgi:hypothetical protein
LEKRTIEIYTSSDSENYKRDVAKYIDFVNKVTNCIPILTEVSLMKGAQTTRIPELRAKHLILNSAGLNIICRIGHDLIVSNMTSPEMDQYIKGLGKIDWEKKANIWRDNIVQQGAAGLKISTANSTIKEAVKKVKIEIGLLPKSEEYVTLEEIN